MKKTDATDAARVELLLGELRLPGIKMMWAALAARADKEGWLAARFLAALAEHEIAERSRRRIARHMNQARLPLGKTVDSFDFAIVPMVSKAQVMALTAGDGWLDNGANLLMFGPWRQKPSGSSRRSCPCRERLACAVHANDRSRPAAPGGAPRTRVRKRHRQARQISPAHPRRPRLCQQGSGGNQRAVRADRRPL